MYLDAIPFRPVAKVMSPRDHSLPIDDHLLKSNAPGTTRKMVVHYKVAMMEVDSVEPRLGTLPSKPWDEVSPQSVSSVAAVKSGGVFAPAPISVPTTDRAHIEDKLDEQDIEIDVLGMEIDQHKQAIREYIKLLEDRDRTIGTQSFVITSLHDSVYRLTGEVAHLSGTVRTQNSIITSLHHSIHRLTDEVAHLSGMIEQTRDQQVKGAIRDWNMQDETVKKRRLGTS